MSAVLNCHANLPEPSTASQSEATAPLPSPAEKVRNFSLQFGVANLTSRNIGEILSGDVESAEGEASGQLYSLTFSWTAHRFSIPVGERTLTPQFEPYLALTIVDEDNRSPFPDYNGGVGFRWVNFPWNDWVQTTFFMGVGFSYSSKVYTIDRLRHPEDERSHLKLDWPIQLTLAHPRWPRHQLVGYIDHQSGGHVFDSGGVNSLGIGYRFAF